MKLSRLIIQDSWAKEGKIFHKTSPPFSGTDFTWERQKGSEDAPPNPFQMVIIRFTSGWGSLKIFVEQSKNIFMHPVHIVNNRY